MPAPFNPLQASRFISHYALLDPKTMRALLHELGCSVYNVSKVLSEQECKDYGPFFLERYTDYINALFKADFDPKLFRKDLTCALTLDMEAVVIQTLPGQRYLAKPQYPIVQLGIYQFIIGDNGRILHHVLGKESICFGLEWSYPQLYRDPKTKQNLNALKEAPNHVLWKKITTWMRKETHLLKIKRGDETIPTQLRLDPLLNDQLYRMGGPHICLVSS
ncbi:MAG: hypothetical protein K9M07_06855 [Simkaniaceae bacterium]|nr:hypothetical protein [Simkaniaceae bacterium]